MFESFIATSSAEYDVPVPWIKAVIGTESSWNPKAYRAEPKINDASYGLMQLLGRTAKSLGYQGQPDGLYDPALNISLGTKLLGQLRSRYGDDFERCYSAYNSGNPDLYLANAQVGLNVARAVDWLSKYVTESVNELTQSPNSALAGLLVLVLLWGWAKKRK